MVRWLGLSDPSLIADEITGSCLSIVLKLNKVNLILRHGEKSRHEKFWSCSYFGTFTQTFHDINGPYDPITGASRYQASPTRAYPDIEFRDFNRILNMSKFCFKNSLKPTAKYKFILNWLTSSTKHFHKAFLFFFGGGGGARGAIEPSPRATGEWQLNAFCMSSWHFEKLVINL